MLRLALLAAAACLAHARVIAFGLQDGLSSQDRPTYAAFTSTQPIPTSLPSSMSDKNTDDAYLMYSDQMQMAWAYQQVDLLNSLQSFMMTPRSPCGHASRAWAGQQAPHLVTSTMNPVVMSYLASSRLASLPSSFDVYAQSEDDAMAQHFTSDAESYADSVTGAADDLVSNAILGALLGSDRTQLQDESEASQEPSAISEDDSVVAQTMGHVAPDHSSLMEGSMDTADWTAFDKQAAMRSDVDDNLSWSIVDDQGHVNWGVVLFSLLCIACGAVWLGLLRTWCALGSSCLSCPRKQRQAQFLTLSADDMHSPLLAPLQHEGLGGPIGAMKSSDIQGAKNIEVASEHAPEGVEYVTIAYAPLKGEA